MEELTADRAIELLRSVVAGRENHVYETTDACVYVRHGAPSCIVGHALVAHGYAPDEVAPLDFMENGISADALIIPNTLPDVTRLAGLVFRAAQRVQDDGKPWAQALAAAEQEYQDDTTDV